MQTEIITKESLPKTTVKMRNRIHKNNMVFYMKIHEKLSKCCQKIDEILNNSDLTEDEEIYTLLQMSIKTYLLSYGNDKSILLKCFHNIYDDIEEQGNILGFIKDD